MTTFADMVYYNGGTPVGGGLPVGADGRVFWVDPSSGIGLADPAGIDSNDGLTPSTAKQTLQAAVDLCEDWRGDLIICKAGTQVVTETVALNVKGLTVMSESMGGNRPYLGERFVIYGSHTDAPAVTISAPCSIIGMGFCGSETTGASVEVDGSLGGFDSGEFYEIRNCHFTHWGVAKAFALILDSGGSGKITGCTFDGLTAGYTTAAIGVYTGVVACEISHNTFTNIGSGIYCIDVAADAHFYISRVEHNYVQSAGSLFIAFNSATSNSSTLICDNFVGTATNATTYDDTVNNLKTAGFLFSGNNYSE